MLLFENKFRKNGLFNENWWQERSCVWVTVLWWIVQFCSGRWKEKYFWV